MDDLTRYAMATHLAALDCREYRLHLRQWTGSGKYDCYMRSQLTATHEQMLRPGWLKRLKTRNAARADVHIVPVPEPDAPRIVLIDDLDRQTVNKIYDDGITPVAVTETSRDNYQAVVRIPPSAHPLAASRVLCHWYDGDKGAISAMQPFKLAGFANKKPGRNSWFVLLTHHDTGARPIDLDSALGNAISAETVIVVSNEVQHRTENDATEATDTTVHRRCGNSINRRAPRSSSSSTGRGTDTSPSGKDWGMACEMLAKGRDHRLVLEAVVNSATARGRRGAIDYAEQLLTNAKAKLCQ